MSRLNDRLREVVFGIAVVVVVLLLGDLAARLTGAKGAGSADLAWAMVALVAAGVVVWLGASRGRSDPTAPIVAAVLLLWPLLPTLTAGFVPRPPGWIPLLGDGTLVGGTPLAVGVLAGGAALRGRRGR